MIIDNSIVGGLEFGKHEVIPHIPIVVDEYQKFVFSQKGSSLAANEIFITHVREQAIEAATRYLDGGRKFEKFEPMEGKAPILIPPWVLGAVSCMILGALLLVAVKLL